MYEGVKNDEAGQEDASSGGGWEGRGTEEMGNGKISNAFELCFWSIDPFHDISYPFLKRQCGAKAIFQVWSWE